MKSDAHKSSHADPAVEIHADALDLRDHPSPNIAQNKEHTRAHGTVGEYVYRMSSTIVKQNSALPPSFS